MRAGHWRGMSRIAIAVPLGLLGFVLYVGLAVTLADQLAGTHWVLQALYFVIAGTVWALPARWLMFWAAGQR
ncbi:DUF2842 domain-containing protein [Roseicella sp. DB1501]|nr:DUF2842 domain-containing protein [Roseicella sp. DB1501]